MRKRRFSRRNAALLLGIAGAMGIAGMVGPVQHPWLTGGLIGAGLVAVLALRKVPDWLRHREERRKFRQAGIRDVDSMDGFEFERYLGHILTQSGYKVLVTQQSGDFGADLVITDTNGERAVVQAKRYTGTVGIKAVQEVVGAKAHYRATQAFCITNSGYTKAAQALAKSNDVALLSRHDLTRLIGK